MKKDEEHTQIPKEEPEDRAGEEDIVEHRLEQAGHRGRGQGHRQRVENPQENPAQVGPDIVPEPQERGHGSGS